MVRFKDQEKEIGYYFGCSDAYVSVVGHCHTGIDYNIGYGKPVTTDNPGIVYKIIREGDLPSNWSAVYMLCYDEPTGEWVEVCYGHLSRIDVQVGQWLEEGQVVGLEGNKGLVYQDGVQITPAMQKAGDKRGSHVHNSYRPTFRVKEKVRGQNYLQTLKGVAYKDKEGNYYQIKHNNPATRGMVDPIKYAVSSTSEKIDAASAILEARGDKDSGVFRALAALLKKIGL